MSKVYVKTDYRNRIIACDGGYGEPYMNLEEWIFIDEGEGAKYDHCQNGYFPMPIADDRGIYRYKLIDGKPVERTADEMDADVEPTPPSISIEERINDLETALCEIMDSRA